VGFHCADERDAESSGAGGQRWKAVGDRRLRRSQQSVHGRVLRPGNQQVDFRVSDVRPRGRSWRRRRPDGLGRPPPAVGVDEN